MQQTKPDERTILVHGTRAIGKALGLSRWRAWKACQHRLLPAIRLGRAFAVPLAAVAPYRLALARELLRREHSLAQPVVAAQQTPRGRWALSASGAVGLRPVRCKKVTPKALEGGVVILK